MFLDNKSPERSRDSINTKTHERHQLIETFTARANEKSADMAIIVWEKTASRVASIIGERGFKSLYVRSIILNLSKFSWLATYNSKSEINNQFTELKILYAMQTPDQIKEANNQLLLTLTDILASLIGESLTTNILYMAWGDVTSDLVFKECNNEQ